MKSLSVRHLVKAAEDMKAACDDTVIHLIADAIIDRPHNPERAIFNATYGNGLTMRERIEAYMAHHAIFELAREYAEEEADKTFGEWFDGLPGWAKECGYAIGGIGAVAFLAGLYFCFLAYAG